MAERLRRSNGIETEKLNFISKTCVAGVTPEIDLLGGTLCGVLLESELTSTYFTVTMARASGGTYLTLCDPDAAGAAKQFSIGSTSTTKFIPISPLLTAGFRYCKINFDQSETPTVYAAVRSLE